MKSTINRRSLLAALKVMKKVTSSKTRYGGELSILAYAKIIPGVDSLELVGTDYEKTLRLTVSTESNANPEEAFTLPVMDAIKIINSMTGENVSLSQSAGILTITSGPTSYTLTAVDAGLYPDTEMKSDPLPETFSVEKTELTRTLELTLPFTFKEEIRRNLMGVSIKVFDSFAEFIATDGHRLGKVRRKLDSKETVDSIILPREAGLLLVQAMKYVKEDSVVSVGITDRFFRFSLPNVTLEGRLIEGRFPDVDQIIPKSQAHSLNIDAAELTTGLKVIAGASPNRIKPTCISLKPGLMTLTSEPSETGQASHRVNVKYAGPDIAIGLNASLVLDMLKLAGKGERVTMEYSESLKPITFRFDSEPDFLAIVMPLRIEWSPNT